MSITPVAPQAHAPAAERTTLTPLTTARQLVAGLVARGVDHFFGIPGGPICPIFEAIRLTPGATLIASRHEAHAAFAASLYQRASGRTPAVVVTAGPGATNAVTGVASASLERTPLLVIAGDVAWTTSGGRHAQDSGPEGIHLEAMFQSITRLRVRATKPDSALPQALAALAAANEVRDPGPALFILALDHAMAEARPIDVVGLDAAVIARTRTLLAGARRPLIVLGAGCRGHEGAVARMVDALGVPFVTTPRAKGLVSERHPSSLRNGGMAASMWARRYTAGLVDVCLVLGTDLDDTSMGPTRYVGLDGVVVHVDRDSRVFARNVPTALGVVAEIGAFCDALGEGPVASEAARAALGHARAESPFDVPSAASDDARPIRPHRLMVELEAALPDEARVVSDIGEHMLFALHYLTAHRPDRFAMQLNLGSMASGIAGSIGLALADRRRPVVCIAGDGGMQMAGMEALVALRERLPILFVVVNDGRYNMVHHGMRQIFGAAEQYDMPFIDFARWATSFGMPARVVEEPGVITSALVSELLESGPALLDVRIDASVRIRGGGRVEALQHMSMSNGGKS